MAPAEKISVLPRIDSVVWFLVVTLMQIYIEKEQTEKRKIQIMQIEKQRSTRKCNRDKFSAKEIKKYK